MIILIIAWHGPNPKLSEGWRDAPGRALSIEVSLQPAAPAEDRLRESPKGLLDVFARLGGGVLDWTVVPAEDLRNLRVACLPSTRDVDFVPERQDGDQTHPIEEGGDPGLQSEQRIPPGDVEDREDALGRFEI